MWQRKWTPALRNALQGSSDVASKWRVLVAYTTNTGELHEVPLDWDLLNTVGRPVMLVVRIEGQLTNWSPDVLVPAIGRIAAERKHNNLVVGIEIDHDAATRRLTDYEAFLVRLRGVLSGLKLSITALPTWLNSSQLRSLLAQVDEAVLQVHAVRNPRDGLFDPGLAAQWITDFASQTYKPFFVALPAYGTRVSWSEEGSIVGVESEEPLLASGPVTKELTASPLDVAELIGFLRDRGVANLTGFVWFRLPTSLDQRAWSLATWRSVVRGEASRPNIQVTLRPSEIAGASQILLRNLGPMDGPVPDTIPLPDGCTSGDGLNGYVYDGPRRPVLRLEHDSMLKGRHERIVGWTRCTPGWEHIHAQK